MFWKRGSKQKTNRQVQPRRKLLFEALEARQLLSADIPGIAALLPDGNDASSSTALHREFAETADAEGSSSASPAQQLATELVIIDANVPDAPQLSADFSKQRDAGRNLEIVVLNGDRDGLAQLSEILKDRRDISALHLISHGADGTVFLGNSVIDTKSVIARAEEIQQWSASFTADADLLLYGCDVAAGTQGRTLMMALSRFTGADVAASEDRTGHQAQNADWILEAHTGTIESTIAVSTEAQALWVHALTLTAQGSETLVNTSTAGTRTTTPYGGGNVAMDSNGNYVVVFNDGSTNDVYFQRYDAAGSAQGGNTRANATTSDVQNEAQVAMDASGNFVVVWTSANQDGGGTGIYAQRYNASGVAQGGEFRVNTTTNDNQTRPTVAMDASGNFVVAWTDAAADGSNTGVYAQRYNASGVAQGGEFRVNTTTTNVQGVADIAMSASGSFVIVWESNQTGNYDTYFQRYNASGIAQGVETRVNTTTSSDQWNTAVAMTSDGSFVIVYEDTSGADGQFQGVFAQRYNASGAAQGGEFRVNATTASTQGIPDVAMDTNGNFVVVWQSDAQESGSWGVYAQHYRADGTASGTETRVNTTTASDQQWASVAMSGGRVVVTWSGNGTGDNDGVFMQRLAATGITVSASPGLQTTEVGGTASFTVVLNTAPTADVTIAVSSSDTTEGTVSPSLLTFTTANWNTPQTVTVTGVNDALDDGDIAFSIVLDPAVSADASYNGINPGDVALTNADNDAVPVLAVTGAETRVNSSTTGGQMTTPYGGGNVAIAADGSFVVAYTDQNVTTGDIYVQRYNAAGVAQGAAVRANTFITNVQEWPVVGMASDGSFVVSWVSYSQDASNTYGIYAQRFDAAGVAQGGEFRVNTTTANHQDVAAIAVADNGSFVIAFYDDGSNAGDVYIQRYNASGTAQGGNVRVNTATSAAQQYPEVAINASTGDFVVVWESYNQDATNSWGIYGQRYNAAGTAQGSEFRINSTSSGDQMHPVVGMAADGSFVIAWESLTQDPGGNAGIYAQRYNAAGVPLGSEFRVNVTTSGDQNTPAIAVRADGRFIVTWISDQDGTPDIYAQEFDVSGNAVGEFRINTTTSLNQSDPAIAFVGGQAVAVWTSNDSGAADVYYQRYTAASGGITVTPIDSTTSESGAAGTFSVVLNTAPTADVTIAVSVSNDIEGSVSTSLLTFTSANWNVAQTITVTGLDDALDDGDRAYTVTLAAAVSGDAAYNGLNAADVALTNADDDNMNTIAVTTTADAADGDTSSLYALLQNRGADGQISLREAIIASNNTANGTGGADRIHFNIAGLSTHTITPLTALPTITGAVILDASTDDSFAANGGRPAIIIDGNNLAADGLVLSSSAGGSTIRGFIIRDFGGDGIEIQTGSDNNLIAGNYIGRLTTTGSDAGAGEGNGSNGVNIGSAGNTIGGISAADRNVISGNVQHGIYIGGAGNFVLGNYIGTDGTGSADIGNGTLGVEIWAAANNVIGGTVNGARNVISGNDEDGIKIWGGGASTNQVLGNYIGLAADGSTDLGNSLVGVTLAFGATNNVIGDLGNGRNIISGNNQYGVRMVDAGTSGNLVQNNFIGTDSSGALDRGNSFDGVRIEGSASGNIIGGTAGTLGNVISGNDGNGIVVSGIGATGNLIRGNLVGTAAGGNAALRNEANGIELDANVGTTIGGTILAARNVVAANNNSVTWADGIYINGGSGHVIQGNHIGVGTDGITVLGNYWGGITVYGASNITIGGSADGAGNLIANNLYGVNIWNSSSSITVLRNVISGNTQLGIDLGQNSVTANDAGDTDIGDNNLQNFPVLATARTDGSSQLILTGTLNSTANSFYRIEFFANTTQDSTGFGEGQTYLGFANVATDGSGNATISTTLTATVPVGTFISATATRSNNTYTTFTDTSEFSRNIAAVSSTQATITVDTTNDTSDGDTTSLSTLLANKGADGFVSLREAIIAANNSANGSSADRITFNIAGAGPHTINVTSVLPTITQAVIIDGTSEPDFAGSPMIELNGGNLGILVKGVTLGLGSDGSTVRGLVINRFTGTGLEISGSGSHTIQGNWIGLNITGTAAAANGVNGIYALNSSGNLIGGTTAAQRNVVSGNAEQGIFFDNVDNSTLSGNYIGTNVAGTGDVNGSASNLLQTGVVLRNGSNGNTIGGTTASARNVISGNNHYGFEVLDASQNNLLQGNYIGTDVTGLVALVNTNGGASFWGSGTGNVFGGTALGARNVITGNFGPAVMVGDSATGSIIQGNYIGVGADGTTALGSAYAEGIRVQDTATNTLIGGTAASAANIIANHALSGVAITAGTGHQVLGNVIYGNTGLGIDLGTSGVTANDAGDVDSGPNNLQNFPVLTSARIDSAGQLAITGTLNGAASSHYRIEFFASTSQHSTGYGEGQRYLGHVDVTTDAGGHVTFATTLTGTFSTAEVLSATATRQTVALAPIETSEFSAVIAVTGPSVLVSPPMLGTETRVNTNTANVEMPYGVGGSARVVAMDSSGRSVVVWNADGGQDGSGWGVFGQRYDANGVAAGGPFQVNTTTTGDQTNATVAMRSDGSYVVVWSSQGQDGSGWGVYGRRYAADGSALGSEFLINQTTAGDQRQASVAIDSSGFVVAWCGAGSGDADGIFARRFDNTGTALGSEFRINTSTANAQRSVSLDVNTSGALIVTWSSFAQDGSNWGIYGQRFDSSANALGSEFRISQATGGAQDYSQVLLNDNGSFVVVWRSDLGGTLNYAVMARRFDASGAALSDEFLIAIDPIGADDKMYPLLDGDAAGNWTVVWDQSRDGSNNGIYGRRYDAAGNPIGNDFRVNTTTSGEQRYPGVAMNASGDFQVVWFGNGSGDTAGVFSQRFLGQARTTEAGGTVRYNVALDSAPTANVTIPVSISNALEASVSSASLTFTPANWNVAQTITVTGLNDTIDDGDRAFSLVLGPAVSADPLFNGADPADLALLNTDDDAQSTIVVDTVADTADGDTSSLYALLSNKGADGFISLREAIAAANNTANGSAGADRIHFNIAGAGPHTLNVTSALPIINGTVMIDATTEPDFAGAPMVELNGLSAGVANGLQLNAGSDGSTIRGLVINRFNGQGIQISSSSNIVVGNYIGTNVNGNVDLGNSGDGIYVTSSGTNNTIGGTLVSDRNIISGNGASGVWLDGTNNTVRGNYIGTDATGNIAVGNSYAGIGMGNLAQPTWGNNNVVVNNVISGTRLSGGIGRGIEINGAGNSIRGNYIGTDAGGNYAINNATDGIRLFGSNNTIGGTTAADRNVISGNTGAGIWAFGANNNTIQGNYFGTDTSGSAVIGQGLTHIYLDGSSNNLIGGTAVGARNILAGSTWSGMGIENGSNNNTVQGNYIGTDVTGTLALGNSAWGILISDNSHSNMVGGTASNAGNVIVNSGRTGIAVRWGSTDNAVLGNSVQSNAWRGIDLEDDGVTPNDAVDADVGANDLQNFPVLASANTSGGNTTIVGTLNSNANTTYRIEFFSTPTGDSSGHGEGQAFLGFTTVTTDGSGNANINTVLTGVSVTAGHVVSATATVDLGGGNYGSTSEFAANVVATNNAPGITVTPIDTTTSEAGATGSFNVVLNTAPTSDVTIAVSVSNAIEGSVSTALLTFTSANWNVAQTVTVTGLDESIDDGDRTYTVVLAPAVSGDAAYNGLDPNDVPLTNTDDDNRSTIVVTTTNDATDGDTSSLYALLTNKGADGEISLREAITAANNSTNGGGGADQIHFSIAGAGPHTINVTSALPLVTDAVMIDATTEPGYAGTPLIQLNGAGAGAFSDGLVFADPADSSAVRGLAINRFRQNAIVLVNASNISIRDNFLGTDVTGTADLGNGARGVLLIDSASNLISGNLISGNGHSGIGISGESSDNNVVQSNLIGTDRFGTAAIGNDNVAVAIVGGADNNLIGGSNAVERNVISGNQTIGITISGAGTTGNVVRGNYIGVNSAGNAALGNIGSGISIESGASNNTIGGSAAGDRNIISGNGAFGLNLESDANVVEGNYFGLNAAGTATLSNGWDAIYLWNGADNNRIGGTSAGAANIITGSNRGVVVADGTGNAILGNVISNNGNLGIDLGNDGVSANDVGDGDAGTNNLQNFPVLSSATVVGGQIRVTGSLNSLANSFYRIELFANTSADGSGYGEGERYLGFVNVATDGAGNATFSTTLTASVVAGEFISATATQSDSAFTTFGDTSEFAGNVQIRAPGITVTPTSGLITTETGGTASFSVVLDAAPTADVTISVTSSNAIEGTVSTNLLTFTAANWSVAQTVIVTGQQDFVSDGNTGYTIVLGSAVSSDTAYNGLNVIDVTATNYESVNQAPVHTVPTSISVTEDIASFITGISVSDSDAGAAIIQTQLSVPAGTFTATSGGSVIIAGSGTDTITLIGSAANINAFIAASNVTYTTAPNANGSVTMTVTTSDLGNSGTGGAQTDVDSVTLNINAVNDDPALINNTGLTVNEGSLAIITSSMLSVSDADHANSQIVYTLTAAPAHGILRQSGVALNVSDTFTQADIDNGLLDYSHDGSETVADSFGFTVSDVAGGAMGATTFNVSVAPVDDPIVLTSAQLAITANGSVVLQNVNFALSDVDATPGPVSFNVQNVQNGHFERLSAQGTAINTFSLTEVAAGQIRFVHAGGNAAPSFDVAASDGAHTTSFVPASISFVPPQLNTPTPPPETILPGALPPAPPKVTTPSGGATTARPTSPSRGSEAISEVVTSERVQAIEPVLLMLQVPQVPTVERAAPQNANTSAPVKLTAPAPLGPTTFTMQPVTIPVREESTAAETTREAESASPVIPEISEALRNDEDLATSAEVALKSAQFVGVALSVGIVSWVLRAAGLLSSLLASLPAWHHIDPLPILDKSRKQDEEEEDQGDADSELRENEFDRRLSTLELDEVLLNRLLKKD